MAVKCRACIQWLAPSVLVDGLCLDCRKRLGLVDGVFEASAEPEACPHCGHDEIVQAQLRERIGDGGHVAPAGVTYAMRAVDNVFSDFTMAVDGAAPAGLLVAHVCRACGHTQIFACRPGEIPIGPEFGTRLVKVRRRTPYRG